MPVTEQVAVTLVADVKPREAAALTKLLKEMGKDAAGNDVLPLGQLPHTHFARVLMLDASEDADGNPLPAHLLYMSDVDGTVSEHLEDLVDLAPAGLDTLLRHCEGYPAKGRVSRATRLAYLQEHAVDAGAAYVNTVGRTLQQIRDEAFLREQIQQYLDGGDFEGVEPVAAREAIRRFVAARDDLRWALHPPPPPTLRDRVSDVLRALGLPAELAAISPVLLPLLPAWALSLRLHELRDRSPTIVPDAKHVRELAALEDYVAQNPFSAVGNRKPGLTRLVTAVGLLRILDYGMRQFFHSGSLTGVKTIHFARWVFLDDRRRLIFASSYDGSLESYMDDFINQVWWGLNAVFSNGVGFPRTSWLVFGGSRDEQAFKDYLRRQQVPTSVWYSAYDDLTAVNIDNNAAIRLGLSKDLSPAQAEEWLQRL